MKNYIYISRFPSKGYVITYICHNFFIILIMNPEQENEWLDYCNK